MTGRIKRKKRRKGSSKSRAGIEMNTFQAMMLLCVYKWVVFSRRGGAGAVVLIWGCGVRG